ncbi:hypothetical protein IAT38_003142 [Cryptococcus sp. DSM 104549]
MRGTITAFRRWVPLMHPESSAEYVESAQDVERLVLELAPAFSVVDHLFEVGRDALMKLDVPCLRLSPNSVKEVALEYQGAGAFQWPVVASGFPYPLPARLLPLNILAALTPIVLFKFDKLYKPFNTARNAAGYPGPLPMFDIHPAKPSTVLCMSSVGAEIPAILPPNVVCCGPILQASAPLEEVDKELFDWVMKRPTVMVVLGSFFLADKKYAENMLWALKALLARRPDVQVLWELQKYEELELSGTDQYGDRLKIVEWLKADPLAVLKTGNVICSVNHGGSNCYHEGLAAGVPQIIMAGWLDCYDFTFRLPYLGHGVWGNKKSAPSCSKRELTKALFTVVGLTPNAPQAAKIRARAQELKEIVTDSGKREGSIVAAGYVWAGVQEALGGEKEAEAGGESDGEQEKGDTEKEVVVGDKAE